MRLSMMDTPSVGVELQIYSEAHHPIASLGTLDVITGTPGDDSLLGTSSDDTIDGGKGNDTIDGSGGNDLLLGQHGDDVLTGGEGNDTLEGGSGGTTLDGGDGDDVIWGNKPRHAGGGLHIETGGDGDDYLFGGTLQDTLSGGIGNDTIVGNGGGDIIHGGDGNDVLLSTATKTHYGFLGQIFGDDGDDIIKTFNSADPNSHNEVTLDGGTGDDSILIHGGGAFGARLGGNDWNVLGGDGQDAVHAATAGDCTLDGGSGDDVLVHLGAGHGLLIGGQGADDLTSGDGTDTLNGGADSDHLTGGHGLDTFLFTDISDSTTTASDLISGLRDDDVIDLSQIDADTTQEGDQAFTVVSTFTSQAGQLTLTFDHGTKETLLLADVDGDGVADFEVRIEGGHTDFTNFVL